VGGTGAQWKSMTNVCQRELADAPHFGNAFKLLNNMPDIRYLA
jgi:hypothetical protein